jgi:hypothetical protein
MRTALLSLASCAALLSSTPALTATVFHTQAFQSSGTFTIPAGAKPGTIFEFTLVGGGGGAGGCGGSVSVAAGGGAGATGFVSLSGFSPLDTVTVTVGAGGAGGAGGGSGHSGSAGGTTALTYSATVIASATGGGASPGVNGAYSAAAGAAGVYSTSVGSTGLTLESSMSMGAQDGVAFLVLGFGNTGYSAGGSNSIGVSGTFTHPNGQLGGGGFGCIGINAPGGAGGDGAVIVRWVL